MLPEITDKFLHSSAVFEYLKKDLLDRNPFINAASVNKLLECDPSRKLYPDGVIPKKEQTKPKKHTADIDR